jgi:hypothetical protein
LARLFPVQAVVTENGAITCARRDRRVELVDAADAATRRERSARLDELVKRAQAEFPDLALSDDIKARVSDRTFDIGEHHSVGTERVAQVTAFLRAAGARTFASSVHLHATFDYDDKASGAVRVLTKDTGLDATAVRHAFAYLGDSENDAACFAAFHVSIGVSNLRGRATLRPRYVTQKPMGAGVAEAAALILSLRQGL